MIKIAYTISPYLKRYLETVEGFRQQIILYPLTPRRELELQFETTVARIHYGLALSEKPLMPAAIRTILANQIVFAMQKNPRRDPEQKAVLNYKTGLDYLRREWLLNPESVSNDDLMHLYSLLNKQPFPIPPTQLSEIVTYVQTSATNPLIQAAIAKLLFKKALATDAESETFSTLCAYLFLYKGGQDCRGMLLLEEQWNTEHKLFLGHYTTDKEKENITSWVEYFIKTVAIELQLIRQKLDQNPTTKHQESIGELNERQKTIMTLLDDPKTVITNRTVQKIFHISQITASRDLAKLTQLGLLFTQGKGRSVRYTRI